MPSSAEEVYGVAQLILLKQEKDFFLENPEFAEALEKECGVKILCAYHEYGKINKNPHIHTLVETKYKPKQTKKLILSKFPSLKGLYKIPYIKVLSQVAIERLYNYITKDGELVYEGPDFSVYKYLFNGLYSITEKGLREIKEVETVSASKSLTFAGQVKTLEKESWTQKVVNDVLLKIDYSTTKREILKNILDHYSKDFKGFDEFIIKRVYNLVMYKYDEKNILDVIIDKI